MRVTTTLVPAFIGFGGVIYTTAAAATGIGFIWLAWRLFRTRDDKAMRKAGRSLFTYSLSYLFIIFLAFLTDHAASVFGMGL